jgi:hypothetical protein
MSNSSVFYKDSPFAELKASDGSARIRIYTYSYEFPRADNRDDADWHMNYISLFINGVTAEINAPIIEGRVLQYLLKEINDFKELKISEVDFSFTEPEFSFTLSNESESDNNIVVSGELIDFKLKKSTVNVKFEFKTNLDMIENFIKGIKCILIEYPPRY